MEIIAIISHLLHFVLAIMAICFCIRLFRHRRAWGWLLVSAVFLEPFVLLLVRAVHGRPLLACRTMTAGSDGILQVNCRFDFPLLYIIAVVGLYMLGRDVQKQVETFDS